MYSLCKPKRNQFETPRVDPEPNIYAITAPITKVLHLIVQYIYIYLPNLTLLFPIRMLLSFPPPKGNDTLFAYVERSHNEWLNYDEDDKESNTRNRKGWDLS